MKEALIQIAMAGMGTLGFSLFFHIRLRNLPAAVAGSISGWILYLAVSHAAGGVFFPSMCAAFLVCIWAEIMARAMKAPVNVFMIPGLIPMIPGSGLYHTMRAVVDGDRAAFSKRGFETALTMMGIVVGMIAASVAFLYVMEWIAVISRFREKRGRKKREKSARKTKKTA